MRVVPPNTLAIPIRGWRRYSPRLSAVGDSRYWVDYRWRESQPPRFGACGIIPGSSGRLRCLRRAWRERVGESAAARAGEPAAGRAGEARAPWQTLKAAHRDRQIEHQGQHEDRNRELSSHGWTPNSPRCFEMRGYAAIVMPKSGPGVHDTRFEKGIRRQVAQVPSCSTGRSRSARLPCTNRSTFAGDHALPFVSVQNQDAPNHGGRLESWVRSQAGHIGGQNWVNPGEQLQPGSDRAIRV